MQHARETFAHALCGGRGDRELVDLAAQLVDLVARLLQMRGEFVRIRRRGVAIGREHAQLGVEPLQAVGDLVAVVAAHHDGKGQLPWGRGHAAHSSGRSREGRGRQ